MHAATQRRRPLRVAVTTTMLSLLSTGGCALPGIADPEAAEYRRIDAQLRAADEYEAVKRTCRARGGIMVVIGGGSRLRSRQAELDTARCTTPSAGLSF